MRYAEVAVDAPIRDGRTFTYSIPAHMTVAPGQMVQVPFGSRMADGVVFELPSTTNIDIVKDFLVPRPVLGVTRQVEGSIAALHRCQQGSRILQAARDDGDTGRESGPGERATAQRPYRVSLPGEGPNQLVSNETGCACHKVTRSRHHGYLGVFAGRS